jgi:bifunctional non-homologous end joining protein LigD
VADFAALHSGTGDRQAVASAFDLLMLDGDDLRRRPFVERKAALRKFLGRSRGGIQYVAHIEGDGEEMFAAVCKHGLEGIVSKKLNAPYRSGPSKSWIKVKKSRKRQLLPAFLTGRSRLFVPASARWVCSGGEGGGRRSQTVTLWRPSDW